MVFDFLDLDESIRIDSFVKSQSSKKLCIVKNSMVRSWKRRSHGFFANDRIGSIDVDVSDCAPCFQSPPTPNPRRDDPVFMQPPARLLVLTLLLFCFSPGLATEQGWKSYLLAGFTMEAPADWSFSEMRDQHEYRFVSPDGATTLLARWWDDDTGRSERDNIRSTQLVVVEGRPAQLLHLKEKDHETLKLVVHSPTTKGRTLTLALASQKEDFSKGSPLFKEVIKRLHFSGKAITSAQPSSAAMDEKPGFDLSNRLGKDCRMVDLAAWHHPALKPIGERRAVHLKWVQLCAGDTYPIFGAEFDYDPQGRTNDFFFPLLIDTLHANQGRPLAFVAIRDRLVMQVRQSGTDEYDFNYAELDNPASTIWPPGEQ